MRIREDTVWRDVGTLKPHPLNDVFNSPLEERELLALRESINQLGIQDAIWITPDGVIIAGHTRYGIAVEKGQQKIQVRVIEDATDADLLYLLVSSNEARRGTEEDLMCRARRASVLFEYWGVKRGRPAEKEIGQADRKSADEVACEMLGTSARTVRRLLKLLELIPDMQELVSKGVIGLMAGNEIASLPVDEQRQIYEAIVRRGIEQVTSQEVKVIRSELDYVRDRREAVYVDDAEDEEFEGGPHDGADGYVSQSSWHTPLAETAPQSLVKAADLIFNEAGVQNARLRYLVATIEKSERQVERLEEVLLPFFDDLKTGDQVASEAVEALAERLRNLADRLREVNAV